ncbi:MAG: arylsulfatase [Phycisphaeraceae bacterium]|nr:arylsulfatase [Phycisphaeraceae bacterium]
MGKATHATTGRSDLLRHAGAAAAALVLPSLPAAAADGADFTLQIKSRPNIVLILADDLGYGDLGCYGQSVIQTPNLDQMAQQGMRFTQHYAGCTVCAPSRGTLMTGLHTGHAYMRGNSNVALPYDTVTVASLLQQAGYRTAMIGKSSIACNDDDPDRPNRLGFDHFFGVLTHEQAHYYYPPTVWRDGQAIELPGNHGNDGDTYVHDLYIEDARQWIAQQAQSDEPFFLFYSAHLPHASMSVTQEWVDKYRGQVGEDRAVENKHYADCDAVKATFAGMVSRLDWEVGQILEALRQAGADENTIVFFASDNGAMNEGGHLEEDFNSSGPLRGVKRDLTEGGIRTPLIVRWPNHVEAGGECEHVSAFWDFLPTACDLAGIATPDGLDGISFLPALAGDLANQKQHEYLYWEFHERDGRRALRLGNFKVVQNDVDTGDSPIEVYDVTTDIGEEHDIADQQPGVVARAKQLFVDCRTTSPLPQFNWKTP